MTFGTTVMVIGAIVLAFCVLLWRQKEPGSDERRIIMGVGVAAVLVMLFGVAG